MNFENAINIAMIASFLEGIEKLDNLFSEVYDKLPVEARGKVYEFQIRMGKCKERLLNAYADLAMGRLEEWELAVQDLEKATDELTKSSEDNNAS